MNSWSQRWVSSGLAPLLVGASLFGIACGGGSAAKHRKAAHDARESSSKRELARQEYVQAQLQKAKDSLRAGHPRKARDEAEQARHAADPDELKVVLAFLGDVDRLESKGVAEEANALAAGKKCREAMDTLAEGVKRAGRSTAFLEAARKATEKSLVGCVRTDLDEAIARKDFASARGVIESPSAVVALGEATWKGLDRKLHDAMVGSLLSRTEKDVSAGRYDAAVATIAAALEAGDIGPDERDGTIESLRGIAEPRELDAVRAAIGSATHPEAVLAHLDATAKALSWTVSPELATSRHALAIWIEARRLGASLGRAEARYTYGATAVHPSDASRDDAKATWPSAKKVWVLAHSGSMALVRDRAPDADATVEDRLLTADGWVRADQLMAGDTADWLLPGAELVGQRVFGPLRKGDKLYYLGVVTAADGGDASVKRLADDEIVKLPRSSLRSGRMPAGTRVMTACSSPLKLEPAKVEREVPQPRGLPLVHVVCEATVADMPIQKDEVPGAIGTMPSWLPPRRP